MYLKKDTNTLKMFIKVLLNEVKIYQSILFYNQNDFDLIILFVVNMLSVISFVCFIVGGEFEHIAKCFMAVNLLIG